MAKLRNLTQQKFTRLTVVERVGNYTSPKGDARSRWLCDCSCGKKVIVSSNALLRGSIKSCGCLRSEVSAHRMTQTKGRTKDLSGQTFGRLFVKERAENNTSMPSGKSYARWLCECSCGATLIVMAVSLSSGRTQSCGCLNRDIVSLPAGEAGFNLLYGRYKYSARRRGHAFELSREEFRALTKCSCFYCGEEPAQVSKGKNNPTGYTYNGLDRRDPKAGYARENCVP